MSSVEAALDKALSSDEAEFVGKAMSDVVGKTVVDKAMAAPDALELVPAAAASCKTFSCADAPIVASWNEESSRDSEPGRFFLLKRLLVAL